jgi:glycosyltransferase involved in cell wall biosynthesis
MPGKRTIGVFCLHDLRAFSSIPYYLVGALKRRADVDVVMLSAGSPYRPSLLKRLAKRATRSLTRTEYLWEKEPARCRHISRQLDASVNRQPVDAVLLFGSEGCAYSTNATPLYCYADSIFGSRIDLYPDQRRATMSRASVREGVLVQQRGLDRLRKLFLSSQWALDRALATFPYVRAVQKCEVVSIGANLPIVPDPEPEPAARDGPVHFLWVGRYWERKNGEFAMDVVGRLRDLGVDAVLDVVGPVRPARSFPWVRLHGELSYEEPDQFRALGELFREAHALLLPSSGETTPLVISEAFAFSRPAVTTRVGGIPEMVQDGQTGLLLPLDSPDAWAGPLREAIQSGKLRAMAPACRKRFETTLNWETVCDRMVRAMGQLAAVA